MSTPAQAKANALNALSSTGPRTEQGKSTSSRNATAHGLFTDHDFIRPGEQTLYADLDEQLNKDLAPVGMLEYELVNEIRRAMWRLRRCGVVEEGMVPTDPQICQIPDPMQIEAQAKLQQSVDRARSQAHRLLHKCTAELRKLQTERLYRNESTEAGTDISHLGVSDSRKVAKDLMNLSIAQYRREGIEADRLLALMVRNGTASFCKTATAPAETPATQSASFCKTPEQPSRKATMSKAA